MSEPRTEAGRRLLREWLDLRVEYAPNTARVRDAILAIEAEAAAPDPRVERLEAALHEILNLAVRSMGDYHPFGPRKPEPNGAWWQADKRAIEQARALLRSPQERSGE